MVRVTRQFSKSIFFSEVRSDLDFNLDCLILWLCTWSSAKENVLTRIYNARRSSRRSKSISFLIIVSVDLLLILDIFSWIIGFFIKIDAMFLQQLLVVGYYWFSCWLLLVTLVIVLKWHSATLNINFTLLSTFHNSPRSNISI